MEVISLVPHRGLQWRDPTRHRGQNGKRSRRAGHSSHRVASERRAWAFGGRIRPQPPPVIVITTRRCTRDTRSFALLFIRTCWMLRYFLYLFAPASSTKELIDSLSSRVQPSSQDNDTSLFSSQAYICGGRLTMGSPQLSELLLDPEHQQPQSVDLPPIHEELQQTRQTTPPVETLEQWVESGKITQNAAGSSS